MYLMDAHGRMYRPSSGPCIRMYAAVELERAYEKYAIGEELGAVRQRVQRETRSALLRTTRGLLSTHPPHTAAPIRLLLEFRFGTRCTLLTHNSSTLTLSSGHTLLKISILDVITSHG